ncbi:unnamed protein product [Prorocentrum cordatum]|uniref:EF-hand domain-containing protein n=1 Tax=Prorocentrum cordatum TaxID=2364126 RepID=A0ABN9VXH2_9DINO|nr:unnamed protein product [Polarella glacialis]
MATLTASVHATQEVTSKLELKMADAKNETDQRFEALGAQLLLLQSRNVLTEDVYGGMADGNSSGMVDGTSIGLVADGINFIGEKLTEEASAQASASAAASTAARSRNIQASKVIESANEQGANNFYDQFRAQPPQWRDLRTNSLDKFWVGRDLPVDGRKRSCAISKCSTICNVALVSQQAWKPETKIACNPYQESGIPPEPAETLPGLAQALLQCLRSLPLLSQYFDVSGMRFFDFAGLHSCDGESIAAAVAHLSPLAFNLGMIAGLRWAIPVGVLANSDRIYLPVNARSVEAGEIDHVIAPPLSDAGLKPLLLVHGIAGATFIFLRAHRKWGNGKFPGSGALSMAEVELALRVFISRPPTEPELIDVFASIDTDFDGTVQFSEFLQLMSLVQARKDTYSRRGQLSGFAMLSDGCSWQVLRFGSGPR